MKQISSLMKLTRTTRHLPLVKGLTSLLQLYRRVLPRDSVYRVSDFDGDLSLDVSLLDCIGVNVWHAPDHYERAERELFCSAISAGSVVLDVGANIGLYTLIAAKSGATVYAIVPDPSNAQLLRNHVALNGFTNQVAVIEMAAADSPLQAQLFRNESNCGGSTLIGKSGGIPVEARTIDSLGITRIDVCKMDIEGSEIRALRGMVSSIAASPNLRLLVEYSAGRGTDAARELLEFVHTRFERIQVVGGAVLEAASVPPPFCNLWCTGVKNLKI